jgi:hypothetical protein
MCRNVVKTCFESYGGDNYSNFYNPSSGLFAPGSALDWFTLYNYEDKSGTLKQDGEGPVSKCAKQVNSIQECAPNLQQIFGGFDKGPETKEDYTFNNNIQTYGRFSAADDKNHPDVKVIDTRNMHNTGVATEIYNMIVGNLRTQCRNYNGYFLEIHKIDKGSFCVREDSGNCSGKTPCYSNFRDGSIYSTLKNPYRIGTENETTMEWDGVENMCPALYDYSIDTKSWGICSCWENGARRGDHKRFTPGCLEANPNYDDPLTTEREDLNVPKNKDGQMCPIPDEIYYPCLKSGGKCGSILIPVSGTSKDKTTFDSKFKKALNDDKIITDATPGGCPENCSENCNPANCPEKIQNGYVYKCEDSNNVSSLVPSCKYCTKQ